MDLNTNPADPHTKPSLIASNGAYVAYSGDRTKWTHDHGGENRETNGMGLLGEACIPTASTYARNTASASRI